jgi:hypothetical protein
LAFPAPASLPAPPARSAGGAEAEKPRDFWFNVNAELIIYGATEPDAKVTLGGQEIKLRSDGTFSFRFALPDGKYDLPAVAVSADGTDGRAAELKFSRETQFLGDVGATPQDPSLQPPLPENLKPRTPMDAPERGALMLVRLIAATLIGWPVLDLALYWPSASTNQVPVEMIPCLLKSLPLLAGVIAAHQVPGARGMDFEPFG